MDLSIIVIGYNIGEFITVALQSVLRQAFSHSVEVIVVDDRSTDNTYDIMLSYADKFKEKGLSYHVLQSPINGGVAYARAQGLKVARGRYTLFLDGDDAFLGVTDIDYIVGEALKEDLDTVIFQYVRRRFAYPVRRMNITSGRDALIEYFRGNFDAMVWFKMWSTDILKRYPFEEWRYYEDKVCTPIWLSQSRRVRFLPIKAYYYRINRGSVTHTVKGEEYFTKAKEYLREYFAEDKTILRYIN